MSTSMSQAAPGAARTKRIMGIDLGTTNSCVAIPIDDEGPDSVLVVTDSYDRPTVPSVVYKTEEGAYLVGYEAKQKMGTAPAPVAFVKRFMGKDHQVELRDETLAPQQVSAIILGHLRQLVREQLGEDITQAVITIPARFDLAGQQATVEAARLAGLEVLTTMPEPIAAALAYGLEDDADNLKIFCYDLGGGTFDATVMAKSAESGIEVLAFDGDEYLGGYNFDMLLANWILRHLKGEEEEQDRDPRKKKSYSLDLDWNNPADLVIYQKLMRIAEAAKVELSKEPEHTISEREAFLDHDGTTVNIELKITRKRYEQLILPLLEQTIEISARAIAKAGLTPERIDRVIMVGGSSRIPALRGMLEQALRHAPQLVDPDKIVARGAAVKAGMLVGASVTGIEFLVPLPARWSLDAFSVAARLTLPQAAQVPVALEREDGGYSARTTTDDQGGFGFDGIELVEGEDNGFELRVGDARAPVLAHQFRVRQDPSAVVMDTETNFMTNDVYLLLSDGVLPIFTAGERIPAEKLVAVYTAHEGMTFAKFNVAHGNHTLGEVVLPKLPEGLPKESQIMVNVRIDNTLAISTTATLVKTGQNTQFEFRIPRPKLPSEEQMRSHLATLMADFNDAVNHVTDNTLKMKQYGEGQRHMRAIEKALAERPCDFPRASRLLDEFGGFVSSLSRIEMMEPTWEAFSSKLADTRQQAKAAEKEFDKARRANFTGMLDGLEAYAKQSFDDKNHEVWREANARLDSVVDEIDSIAGEEKRRKIIDSMTPEQIAHVRRQILSERLLEAQAQMGANPRLARHEDTLQKLIREVNGLNPGNPAAVADAFPRLSAAIDELMKHLAFEDGKVTGGRAVGEAR